MLCSLSLCISSRILLENFVLVQIRDLQFMPRSAVTRTIRLGSGPLIR